MTDGLAWIDGRIVPLEGARVPLADRGHLLGDGIFETMRTERGHIFLEGLHRTRFEQGLSVLGLPRDVGARAFEAVHGLLQAADPAYGPRLYLRLQTTTGIGEDVGGEPGVHAVTAFARRLRPYPETHYTRGIHVVLSAVRKLRSDPLSAVKTTSRLPFVVARREARAANAQDALLLNDGGRICEATTSNVVAVRGRELFAPGPGEGALDGATRRLVLDWADEAGLDVVEALAMDDLAQAEEMFLTNTIGGIVPVADLPVADIAGRPLKLQGAKGRWTREFGERYRKALERVGTASTLRAARRT